MVWVLFLISLASAWNGVAAESKGIAGALFQTMFLIVGFGGMVGAMYLRSLGW